MDYDKDKVDELVLALLYLTSSRDKSIVRAWKGIDQQALYRLSRKGYINEPKMKEIAVVLTEEGAKLSQELFLKYFSVKE